MSRSLAQGVHSALDQGDHDTARALLDLAHACICLSTAEARTEETARVAAEADVEQQRVQALKTQAEADRADTDRTEAAALEAEDPARLTPRERAAAPDMHAVSPETVQEAFGVSHTVAGQRRQAADLIATGCTG
ncbi:hypothetical protein [Streptomyces sp. NRRL F-5193]|uniref:hypothetical protein n=1 Tax=Streptomyces sp. NRRL F-5193 TaxID=1463860 RepID=UPI0005BB56CE|nr:hypothetical protein [Streptomyces sp. NRRL F-5193]